MVWTVEGWLEFNAVRLAMCIDFARVHDGEWDDLEEGGFLVKVSERNGYETVEVRIRGYTEQSGNFARVMRDQGFRYCGRANYDLPEGAFTALRADRKRCGRTERSTEIVARFRSPITTLPPEGQMGSEAIESTGAEYEFNEIRLAALADLASVDEDGIYDDSEVSGLIVEWFEVIGFEHLRVILAGPQVAEGFTGNFAQAARTAGYQYCGRAVRYLPDLDKHAIVLKAYRKNGER